MRKSAREIMQAQVAAELLDTPLALTRGAVERLLVGLREDVGLRRRDLAAELWDDDEDDNRQPLAIDNGIATIAIQGTLRKHARWYDRHLGLTSYEALLAQIAKAARHTGVQGVLLRVESPGGSVQGMFEVADALAALGREKPLHAVADETAASAAYLFASQAARLIVPSTGMLGSVGVLSVRLDASAANVAEGLTFTFIKSGERKGDGHPAKPLETAELASLQKMVDTAADAMLTRVAAGRRSTVEAIARLEGDTFMGADAVAQGLADVVGTVNDALEGLRAAITQRQGRTGIVAENSPQTPTAEGAEIMDKKEKEEKKEPEGGTPPVAGVATAQPEAKSGAEVIDFATDPRVVKLRDEAAADAQAKESARIEAITDACALAECPAMIAALTKDREVTAENVAHKLQAIRAKESDATAIQSGLAAGGAAGGAKTLNLDAYDTHWDETMAAAQAKRPAPLVG